MIYNKSVLRIKKRLCVCSVHEFIVKILIDAHSSRYFVQLDVTKMYHDLRHHYWWGRIKYNIGDIISLCPN